MPKPVELVLPRALFLEALCPLLVGVCNHLPQRKCESARAPAPCFFVKDRVGGPSGPPTRGRRQARSQRVRTDADHAGFCGSARASAAGRAAMPLGALSCSSSSSSSSSSRNPPCRATRRVRTHVAVLRVDDAQPLVGGPLDLAQRRCLCFPGQPREHEPVSSFLSCRLPARCLRKCEKS